MVQTRINPIVVIVVILVIIAIASGAWFFLRKGTEINNDDAQDDDMNRGPTARAGLDRVISPGETVVLDGSLSNDPDGDSLSYSWDVDDSVDSNGDGIYDNDADHIGVVVEHTYPLTEMTMTYRVTLNVSDGKKYDKDTLLVTIYVGSSEDPVDINMSCSYTIIPPPLPGDPYYTVTIESVSSQENILNFSYVLRSPDGDVILEGGVFPLMAAPPNATIRYVDSNPRYQDVSAGDVVLIKDIQPVLEGSSFEIYYKTFNMPAGNITLTRS
ncbi:MAG: PKD domain-containing protein [Candidatus Thermoplasmatota archaeon]|nr:PKD domain-containing protein [Candidatus Thermoplasmatota archaeon]